MFDKGAADVRNGMNRWLVLLVVAVVLVSGCARSTPEPSGQAQTPTGEQGAAPAGGAAKPTGTLRIAWGEELDTLDPHAHLNMVNFSILHNVFDTLVFRDESGAIQPRLAVSWTAEGNTWEFKLRQGVTFHDGTPFNAEAVKYSLERVVNPDKVKGGVSFLFADEFEGAEVADEYTIRVRTKVPYASFLANLTLLEIVHPKHAEAASFATQPVGTGPFKIVEWSKGEKLILEANEAYWDGAPKVARVEFYPLVDSSARLAAIRTGEVDIAQPIPVTAVESLNQVPSLEVKPVLSVDTTVISLGGKNPPWNDPRVWQAVSLGVDREGIVSRILKAVGGQVATSHLSPSIAGYKKMPATPYDPERAKQLLQDAGWPADKEAVFIIPKGLFEHDTDIAQAVADQLSRIGMKVKVQVMEANSVWPILGSGNFDMILNGWGTMTRDADFNYWRNYHSSMAREGFSSAEVDNLLQQARTTFDEGQRGGIYGEVEEVLWEAAPRVALYHVGDIYAINKRVKGLEPRADKFMLLYEVSVEG